MKDLSIVIVSYNVCDLLIRNIKSIFEYTKDISFQVFVVDNNSKDDTVLKINEIFKKEIEEGYLKIYDTKINNGFSKGNNIPINDINSRYVLYMNPDMEIEENVFKKQYDFMAENPECSFSTCVLKYPDDGIQHTVKGLPNFWVNLFILLKLHHFIKPGFLKKYFLSDFDYSKKQKVDQIMGAFVFARYDAIKSMSFWSEDYWLWWEDVDLCKRTKDKDMIILHNPDTFVYHYEGRSFFQLVSLDRQKRFNKGMLIYSKKYFPFYQYFILKIVSYISLGLAFVVQVLKIKPRGQGKI